jgi:hypothetical protein
MTYFPCKKMSVALLWLAAVGHWSSTAFGQAPPPADAMSRHFGADAKVYSLRPGEESTTYRSSGSGKVGPNGTLTLGIGNQLRHFDVRIAAQLKAQRFLATVTVKPTLGDTLTKAQEIACDLSDLTPRTLEIAQDEDGRVYRLSLVPSIHEYPPPRQFKVTDLRLEHWGFPSSPVLLNDQDYIGRLGMASGPLAWCDIPGLAKIEFSLLHLKDALPLGTLANGVITIWHENGTTLQISDVKNGANQDVLSGGPYRVWVRWKKPSQTIEEYRESLKRQVVSLKERINSGDLTLPAGTLERLEKMSESGRVGLTGNGIRGVEPGELVPPVE